MNDLIMELALHPKLETERLLLRPITLLDAKDMFEFASDIDTTKFVFKAHKNLEETKYIIANQFLTDPIGKYSIELKETGKMIGIISYNRINKTTRTAEIGYTLNKLYRGKGFMPEALGKLIQSGFDLFKFNSLMAVCDELNNASGRVIEKCGLKYLYTDPYSRFDFYDNNRMVTDVFYRLTKEEYYNTSLSWL